MPINSPRYRWIELDGEQRAELNQQIVDLTEAFLDDITHLQAGQSFAETTLVDYLPRQFLPYYNLAFAKRFLVAFLTVTWKLTDPEAVHNCANQAEELALYALIQATRDALPPAKTTWRLLRRRCTRITTSCCCSTPPKTGSPRRWRQPCPI